MSGSAACGAAVKADGYGIGARQTVRHLGDAGCRDFFVATWAEAEEVLPHRSEEHTSELQSLMRISYAVFCLKKKNNCSNRLSCTPLNILYRNNQSNTTST